MGSAQSTDDPRAADARAADARVVRAETRPVSTDGRAALTPKNDAAAAQTTDPAASQAAEVAKRHIEVFYRDFFLRHHGRVANVQQVRASAAPPRDQSRALREHALRELDYVRERRNPMSVSDFIFIRKIGHGSFGEVFLVQLRANLELYALKKIPKKDMLMSGQVAHVWLERFVLATVGHHPNVVKMHFSFQDKTHLYFVMEYLPGGDLLTMLIRMGSLPEDWARFFMAELVVAIDALHSTGIIHRDVKPDNLIFGTHGHIRVTDFGLSKSLFHFEPSAVRAQSSPSASHEASSGEAPEDASSAHRARQLPGGPSSRSRISPSFVDNIRSHCGALIPFHERMEAWKKVARMSALTAVGTLNYIAPEVLLRKPYTESADWWSVGVILYEMLFGCVPFFSETTTETIHKIINHRHVLEFPPEDLEWISEDAVDLIVRLLTDADHRLGAAEGIDEFKRHPFFHGIDWDHLEEQPPPFVPDLRDPFDTRYFDEEITSQVVPHVEPPEHDVEPGLSTENEIQPPPVDRPAQSTSASTEDALTHDDELSFTSSSVSRVTASSSIPVQSGNAALHPGSSRDAPTAPPRLQQQVTPHVSSPPGLETNSASNAPQTLLDQPSMLSTRSANQALTSKPTPRRSRRQRYHDRCTDPEFVGFTFIAHRRPVSRASLDASLFDHPATESWEDCGIAADTLHHKTTNPFLQSANTISASRSSKSLGERQEVETAERPVAAAAPSHPHDPSLQSIDGPAPPQLKRTRSNRRRRRRRRKLVDDISDSDDVSGGRASGTPSRDSSQDESYESMAEGETSDNHDDDDQAQYDFGLAGEHLVDGGAYSFAVPNDGALKTPINATLSAELAAAGLSDGGRENVDVDCETAVPEIDADGNLGSEDSYSDHPEPSGSSSSDTDAAGFSESLRWASSLHADSDSRLPRVHAGRERERPLAGPTPKDSQDAPADGSSTRLDAIGPLHIVARAGLPNRLEMNATGMEVPDESAEFRSPPAMTRPTPSRQSANRRSLVLPAVMDADAAPEAPSSPTSHHGGGAQERATTRYPRRFELSVQIGSDPEEEIETNTLTPRQQPLQTDPSRAAVAGSPWIAPEGQNTNGESDPRATTSPAREATRGQGESESDTMVSSDSLVAPGPVREIASYAGDDDSRGTAQGYAGLNQVPVVPGLTKNENEDREERGERHARGLRLPSSLASGGIRFDPLASPRLPGADASTLSGTITMASGAAENAVPRPGRSRPSHSRTESALVDDLMAVGQVAARNPNRESRGTGGLYDDADARPHVRRSRGQSGLVREITATEAVRGERGLQAHDDILVRSPLSLRREPRHYRGHSRETSGLAPPIPEELAIGPPAKDTPGEPGVAAQGNVSPLRSCSKIMPLRSDSQTDTRVPEAATDAGITRAGSQTPVRSQSVGQGVTAFNGASPTDDLRGASTPGGIRSMDANDPALMYFTGGATPQQPAPTALRLAGDKAGSGVAPQTPARKMSGQDR